MRHPKNRCFGRHRPNFRLRFVALQRGIPKRTVANGAAIWIELGRFCRHRERTRDAPSLKPIFPYNGLSGDAALSCPAMRRS
jgi:hypothetical protein